MVPDILLKIGALKKDFLTFLSVLGFYLMLQTLLDLSDKIKIKSENKISVGIRQY